MSMALTMMSLRPARMRSSLVRRGNRRRSADFRQHRRGDRPRFPTSPRGRIAHVPGRSDSRSLKIVLPAARHTIHLERGGGASLAPRTVSAIVTKSAFLTEVPVTLYRSGMRKIYFGAIVLLLTVTSALAAPSARKFGGVGIDGVPQADGQIAVRQLVVGGPAHRAGIRNGDIITKIDGKATRGSTFQDIVEYRLRGRAGTKISLTVERSGEPKPLHFTLTRQQLVSPKK